MSVWIVYTEWNRPHDCEGGCNLEGIYDNPIAARRASWACMREYIGYGHRVFGRRHDSEWDCDVQIEERPIQSIAVARS